VGTAGACAEASPGTASAAATEMDRTVFCIEISLRDGLIEIAATVISISCAR